MPSPHDGPAETPGLLAGRKPPPLGRKASPRVDRRELAAIYLGGAAGALLRVWLGRAIPVSASGWPWVIFAINVSGSFLLGLVVALLRDRRPRSYGLPLLGAGFCGAYTTFSTMLVELLTMIERDRFALAGGYLFASVGAGYAAIAIANHLARRLPVSG